MLQTVELPLWLVIVVLLLAAVAMLDRIVGPGLRWFFRRRMERAVARLNQRLKRPIQPFKLVRRQDQVVRLIHDPHVMEAVAAYAEAEGVPENVAFERARSYAREIVPGFSTATYFGIATRIARRISQGLYDVRLGGADSAVLDSIDERAAVVFVINHRSNMDYVLVTWLAAERSALSYAVGEWARVWPLRALIRAMGAYFIRRRYSSALYRAVLARYVQISLQQGVTQAMFPEGGLSLNGAVGPGRKGLLHYIMRDFDPNGARDVVFVPVAVNYDRVLEDRVLISAYKARTRRFPVRLRTIAGFVLRILWQRFRGRFNRFGYAVVCYGSPVSLNAFLRSHPAPDTHSLVNELMQGIRRAVPVLPVPLAAAALALQGGKAGMEALGDEARKLADELHGMGAWLHLPDGDTSAALDSGLASLRLRGILHQRDGMIEIVPGQQDIVSYYAASVLQRRAEGPNGPASSSRELPPAREGET